MDTPVLKSQVENTNFVNATRFVLNFARLPNLSYFCQTVVLPGLTVGEATIPTPFSDMYAPGDKMVYDQLTATFIVDENFATWDELHFWMRGYSFPTTFDEYKNLRNQNRVTRNLHKPQYSDLEVVILNNAQQANFKFKFYNAFPVSLGSINFSASDSPDTTLVCDVSLRYDYFDRVKV